MTKILAENQKDVKIDSPLHKESSRDSERRNSDSEEENAFAVPTSTPIRSKMTAQNNTPLVNRNM